MAERRRVEVDIHRGNGPVRAQRTLARGPAWRGNEHNRPWLDVRVQGVHVYECPATKNGKREGPCSCGADKLFDGWLGVKRG